MTVGKEVLVRVLLVDDHEVLRHGMRVIFEIFDDLLLVGEAANGREAVTLCETLQPDVVLMDLIMQEMDGVTATQLIRRHNPAVQVVVLSSFSDEKLVQSAYDAGIVEYLLKNVSIDEIADAIRRAALRKPGTVS
jgi:two-component system, NarL family, response regulator LiaR